MSGRIVNRPGRLRIKALRLRVRTRRRRGRSLRFLLRSWRRGDGVRGLLGLFGGSRWIYDRGVVFSFLLSRGRWSNSFGFLLTRSEERGGGQDAESFFHG